MKRHLLMTAAVATAFALVAAGCGKKEEEQAVKVTTLPVPTFADGSTMSKIQKAGKVNIGVKFDQPGFGQKNPTTQKVEGFDIEVAKDLAWSIFGGTRDDAASKINFVEAVSKNREPFIKDGQVDMVVATYTINDARKQVVDFAGPYYVAHGDIMVKSENTTIRTVADLNGKKVCTVQGSTYPDRLKSLAPQADVSLFDNYTKCEEALRDGRVEAETTDNGILAGLVQASNGQFKLVGANYTDEPYGIGVKKGDTAFLNFLNDRLSTMESEGTWKGDFEATLGTDGLKLPVPTPPAIDRYYGPATTTTAAGAMTTTTVAGANPNAPATTTTAVPTTTAKP